MKKKILLINRGVDTDNLGDQAINYTLKRMFESKGVLVESVNYTMFFTVNGSKFKSAFRNLRNMYKISKKKANVVVIGGGQLIQSNKTFPLSLYLWTLLIKLFSANKVVLFGVGVDENYDWFKKLLFKRALSRISKFYVRDGFSHKNLKNIFSYDSKVVPDSVLSISKLYSPESKKTNLKLFGITHYGSIKRYKYINATETEYLKQQAELLLSLENYTAYKLFYNTKTDFVFTLKFQKYLKETYNYSMDICKTEDLFAYIELLNSATKVVSSRMHALIIAHSYGIDIVPIKRNNKLEVFAQTYKSLNVEDCLKSNIKAIDEIVSS